MFKPSLIRSRKAVAIIAGLTLLAGGAGVVVAQSAQEPIIWDKRRLDQLDRNVRRLERALYQRNAAGQPLLVEPDPEVIALRGQVNGMERRLSDLEATLQRVNADLARSTLALDEASSATDGLRERLLDSEGRITKLEGQISALEAARAAVEDETKDAALAGRLQTLADGLDASGDVAERIAALKDVLEAVATTLR